MNHPEITSAEETGYGPGGAPELVEDCQACGGEMYRYEQTNCPACGIDVHTGCLVTCCICCCGHQGCKGCMIEDEATGEIICSKDCQEKLNEE